MRELGVARRITAVVINIVVLIVLLIVLGLLFHFPDRRRGADHPDRNAAAASGGG